jgi:hypothetical protein
MVRGHASMRWGDRLESCAGACPGDVMNSLTRLARVTPDVIRGCPGEGRGPPPVIPGHDPGINADPQNPSQPAPAKAGVLVRSDNEAVVVNIDTIDPH